MLDDKEIFIPGEFNIYCMSCNRKYKASEIRKRWDGLLVCNEDWEPRHPQDFVRGIQEKSNMLPFMFDTDGSNVAMSQYQCCTLENSVGIAGVGAAGCAVAGVRGLWEGGTTDNYYDGISGAYTNSTISGIFVAGWGISGTQ